MASFEVVVTRTVYSEKTYQVEASSVDDAKLKAEQEAANEDWTGDSHAVVYESGAAPVREPSLAESNLLLSTSDKDLLQANILRLLKEAIALIDPNKKCA